MKTRLSLYLWRLQMFVRRHARAKRREASYGQCIAELKQEIKKLTK